MTYSSSGGDAGGAVLATSAVCGFDYAGLNPGESGLPNCCTGAYNYREVDNTQTPAVITNTASEWSGKQSACLMGAGAAFHPDANGWPRAEIIKLVGTSSIEMKNYSQSPMDPLQKIQNHYSSAGVQVDFENMQDMNPQQGIHLMGTGTKSFDVLSPMSFQYSTNLYAANYVSTTPAASGPFASPANVSYDWGCFDEAGEKYARIGVQIQEWNLNSEYAKKSSGDPNSTGTETDFSNPKNDLQDWGDYGVTNYPEDNL